MSLFVTKHVTSSKLRPPPIHHREDEAFRLLEGTLTIQVGEIQSPDMEDKIKIENQEAQDQEIPPSPSSWPRSPKRHLYLLGRVLYRAVPPRLRAFLAPIAAHVVLLRRLRPEVWIITGEERVSHLPLSVCLYSVTEEYRDYLQNVTFGDLFQARYLGHTWLWRASSTPPAAAGSCSILIAEVHERHLKQMGTSAGIVVPAWIRGHALLPRGPEVMQRSSIKEILRKMRQRGWEYEVTGDPEKFDYFYQKMYVPHTKTRFGDSAFLSPREKLKAKFDSGELIFVRKQNEYVSGALLVYEGDVARMPFLGVRDGEWELVVAGALVALYEFILQHLEQRGFRSVDLGESRTFLNDGVLRFKMKYGHTISSASVHKFLIRVLSDTNAARAFLQNNPFIFQHADELRGAVFLDAAAPPSTRTLHEIHKEHSHPGLSELMVFSFAPAGAATLNLPTPLPDSPSDTSDPPQDQPFYQHLTSADYAPVINRLGPIGIANAIAIRPHEKN
ncbi:MAG: GNAT family N-acetyltransferase [Acidobacteriota bacterium]|nr:GNAT family N-acetyltransferase [Acidobacteriota bacterium]